MPGIHGTKETGVEGETCPFFAKFAHMEPLNDKDVRNVDFSSQVLLSPVRFLLDDLLDVSRSLGGHVTHPLEEDDFLRLLLLWKEEMGFGGNAPLQVLLITEPGDGALTIYGGRRVDELQGLSLETSSGEVSFILVPTDGMITVEELYKDLAHLVLSSKKVRKLLLLPLGSRHAPLEDDALRRILEDLDMRENDERVLFLELFPTSLSFILKQSLVPALAHVLGFRP